MNNKTRKIFLPIAILVFGVLGMIVLVIAYPEAEQVKPEAFRPLVRYQLAKKSNKQINIYSQGTVAPRTQSTVAAQVGGQIVFTSSRFASGGYLKKGDVLLRIDPANYELAQAQAKLQVTQAELRLAREKEEADLARSEWTKIGNGEASKLVLREPQLKEAEASLDAAKAALKLADINLQRTEIRAPFTCRIRTIMADLGQVVNPGTPIAVIYAIDYAEIRLPLPDADLAFIDIPFTYGNSEQHAQPKVKIKSVFAGREYTWPGKLVRMEGEIDPRSRMINAVATVKDPYGDGASEERPPLAVGMFVSAEISGKNFEDVFEIERAALRGSNRVWIIDEENRLYFRDVEILRLNTDTIIIKSGLDENEKICLTALDAVVEGMAVRIQE